MTGAGPPARGSVTWEKPGISEHVVSGAGVDSGGAVGVSECAGYVAQLRLRLSSPAAAAPRSVGLHLQEGRRSDITG